MTDSPLAPLISTKLFIPRVRRELVKRPRITAILNNAAQYPLTLVSSLAGSGKTTALAEWVKQLSIPAAWFSIDEGDNDLNRFLTYFVTAVQAAVPGAGQIALETARSPEPLSVETTIASLINDLAKGTTDFVLVLDDYHLIKSRSIHKALLFLIEHIPDQMHLVIATRADPILPLARLRAKNCVLELRIDQLRFTPGETAEYLNQVMRLGLSDNDLTIFRDRTEGWISSLQMAALSLKQAADENAFIRAFSGNNRYILDYLVEEVLSRQPDDVQAFLLQTSLLGRMCGPLCDAVTGKENGEQMLEYLDSSNLFLVPLDDERQWYRYHHLFADLLRSRLARSPHGQNQKSLHTQAAVWYEGNGFIEEAIHHALAAEDYPRSAQLVEGIVEKAWLNGQYTTILKWIHALPVELVHNRPNLCIWNAWSLTQIGSLQDVTAWVEAAKQAVEKQSVELSSPAEAASSDAQAMAYELATLQAFAAGLAQDYDRAVDLAARVLENPLPQNRRSSLFARCNILHVLSSMYYAAGELTKTEQTCLETIRLSKGLGFSPRFLHAVNKLAYVYRTTGQLHRAGRLLQETLSLSQDQGIGSHFAAASLRCRLVDLLYEWNHLEEARRLIDEQLQPETMADVPYLFMDLYNTQAYDLLLRQDFTGTQNALDKALALTRKAYIWPGLIWRAESLQVRLWLQKGDVSRATAWISEQPENPSEMLPFSSESHEMARARILLAQGSPREAIGLLDRLVRSAEAGGRKGSLVEICILRAIAYQSNENMEEAVATLECALSLAESEGYVRTFIDEGSPVAAILSQIVQENQTPHMRYALQLLTAIDEERGSIGPEVQGADSRKGQRRKVDRISNPILIEPLSSREREVLGCMAAGLSNSETARRLVIETSTVKRHINSIFAKLGVNNRVQALNKAREFDLL